MHAIITRPTKTAMQSGTRRTLRWRLSFEEAEAKFIDPMMGWIGSRDTGQQVDLWFDSCDAAVAYAKRRGIDFEIHEPQNREPARSSYADNFSYRRIRTH